jgi:ABC-type glutathione transport system ATPase component
MSAIIVKDLVKHYGRFTAVQNVSFEVASGQVTALLGPNGAGKTTTIEILEGFLAPTAGTVQVLGVNPRTGGRAWRARIGLVLQTTSLDAQLTVAEALMMFGTLYPKPRRVAEVLDLIVLGGAFGAITSLPHWVNTAMTYLPVQPAIDAASRALQQSSGAIMSVHDVAVLAGWVVGGLLISFWSFQWDPHRPAHARPAEARATLRSAE